MKLTASFWFDGPSYRLKIDGPEGSGIGYSSLPVEKDISAVLRETARRVNSEPVLREALEKSRKFLDEMRNKYMMSPEPKGEVINFINETFDAVRVALAVEPSVVKDSLTTAIQAARGES